MPGYETDRFVNLSQNDKSELTCSICQDIFCSPLVAQCCQQSFCDDCINDWLKDNNTCPYDRKTLTSNELSRPPRVMLNMLGKLEIHCDFKEKGCKEVVLLENLSQHTVMCGYNVGKCKKCLIEIQDKSSHDCIKTLLELNRKANEEIETLKRNTCAKISDKQSFDQARNSLWNPEVINNVMNDEMTDTVLSIIRAEILKEYNNGFVFCKNIVDKLNTELGSRWHCIASHQQPSTLYYTYEPGHLVRLKFGELYLEIYKTQYLNVQELGQRIRTGKIKREIQILVTDMKQNMISDVKKFTFEAFEKSNTLSDISSELKTQMEKKYKGEWQCFVYGHFGASFIQYALGTRIFFCVDSLRVTLFKASA